MSCYHLRIAARNDLIAAAEAGKQVLRAKA